ncbi:hypothetical protein ACQ9BO_08810 [Flavobacterium sp. P21]|uniref:hypothetical protein n=1 Tax=Flavobacterium sp. P21 TaxID=3423948 RepID=UPI003D66F031
MKTKEEHKIKLKQISDLAFSHGVEAIKPYVERFSFPNSWSKEVLKLFMEKCHEGFKMAQGLIIDEVLYYQSLLREKKFN